MKKVEVEGRAGFCFGVVRAISKAEEELKRGGRVCSLGDIVHNRVEVQRLEGLGLRTVSHADMPALCGSTLFIRAHGEPPATFNQAQELGIEVVDATCPVVAKLQGVVREAYEQMQSIGGQVVILGKKGHAEVVGLTGQVRDDVTVVEREQDLESIDFSRPIYFLSQTTQSIALFEQVRDVEVERAEDKTQVTVRDTICRQVANRDEYVRSVAQSFDVVIFVAGRKSSNGKGLFEACRGANPRSYCIEEPSEIEEEWLEDAESVGICGATSTPQWVMQQVYLKLTER